MINTRTFSANVGDTSTGNAGPDAIETDIDNLLANDQELLGITGSKSNLTTTDKTNLVNAINEHEEQINSLTSYPLGTRVTDLNNFKELEKWAGVEGNFTLNIPGAAGTYGRVINIGYAANNFTQILISVANKCSILKRSYIAWDTPQWGEWEMFVTDKKSGWITATLQNGWVAFGAPYDSSVRYYKDNLGIVRLKGVVKSGTTAINTVILQLPVGYRPAQNLAFSCYSSEYSKVQIDSTGQLLFISGTNSALSLDGITFRAEQ